MNNNDEEPSEKQRASIAIIHHPVAHGLILGVSRKNNPNNFGFPGGMVENDETNVETLIREVQEECGLKVVKYNSVFSKIDEQGVLTEAFEVEVENIDISTEETGVVSWVCWEKLMAKASSSFSQYNKELYSHLVAQGKI